MKTMKTIPPFFGEYGDSITFSSREDCRPDAPAIAWRPDSPDFRQKKEHGERLFLNLYLDWVFKKMPFAFDLPMQITHAGGQGEPDFFVCENGRRYGLEIARATTWRNERELDELMKAAPRICIGIDADLNGEDQNNNPKAAILPVGGPFYGKPLGDLERKWAKCTMHRISKKLRKLEKNYSRFFPSCDLVLYSACSITDLKSALELLQSEYLSLAGTLRPILFFQRIVIVCETWAIFEPLGTNPQVFAPHHFIPQGNFGVK